MLTLIHSIAYGMLSFSLLKVLNSIFVYQKPSNQSQSMNGDRQSLSCSPCWQPSALFPSHMHVSFIFTRISPSEYEFKNDFCHLFNWQKTGEETTTKSRVHARKDGIRNQMLGLALKAVRFFKDNPLARNIAETYFLFVWGKPNFGQFILKMVDEVLRNKM